MAYPGPGPGKSNSLYTGIISAVPRLSVQGYPSLAKGDRFRAYSRRSSRVQIPSLAPVLHRMARMGLVCVSDSFDSLLERILLESSGIGSDVLKWSSIVLHEYRIHASVSILSIESSSFINVSAVLCCKVTVPCGTGCLRRITPSAFHAYGMSIVIENSSVSITSRIHDARYSMRIETIRNTSYRDGSRLAASGSRD